MLETTRRWREGAGASRSASSSAGPVLGTASSPGAPPASIGRTRRASLTRDEFVNAAATQFCDTSTVVFEEEVFPQVLDALEETTQRLLDQWKSSGCDSGSAAGDPTAEPVDSAASAYRGLGATASAPWTGGARAGHGWAERSGVEKIAAWAWRYAEGPAHALSSAPLFPAVFNWQFAFSGKRFVLARSGWSQALSALWRGTVSRRMAARSLSRRIG